MVVSTFSGSVVAKMKMRCSGGSSTIFSSALKPCGVTMCASSMTKMRYRDSAGAYIALSRRSRMSSTLLCDAASNSTTSRLPGPPGPSATHDAHFPHGVAVGPSTQLRLRAKMRADDVLPQPRGPENRYAWLIRSGAPSAPRDSRAADRGSVTCRCPTTSANVAGRYFLYRATRPAYRPRRITDRPRSNNSGCFTTPTGTPFTVPPG